MQQTVFTMEDIAAMVKPLADKYRVKEIYLFGSYARGEADENSDLDFLWGTVSEDDDFCFGGGIAGDTEEERGCF